MSARATGANPHVSAVSDADKLVKIACNIKRITEHMDDGIPDLLKYAMRINCAIENYRDAVRKYNAATADDVDSCAACVAHAAQEIFKIAEQRSYISCESHQACYAIENIISLTSGAPSHSDDKDTAV